MFHRRALRSLIVLAALALVLTILPAAPVAAASCYNRSCDGKNPNTTGCSTGAQTLGSVNISSGGSVIGKVEMRHSAACAAFWTRVTSYIGTQYLHAEIYRWVNGGSTGVVADDYYTSNYTYMLGGTTEAMEACGRVAGSTLTCYWRT